MRISILIPVLAVAAALPIACSDDPKNTTATSTGASSGGASGGAGGEAGMGGSGGNTSSSSGASFSCADDLLPLQNPRAFTLGETFYLPRVLKHPACSAITEWSVAVAPIGSKNLLWKQGAPEPRFTPDLPGKYLFTLNDPANSAVQLIVVERTPEERFRNHYLTPLFGATNVDGELWIANGASYTVSNLVADGNGNWSKSNDITVGSWPSAIAHHPQSNDVIVALRGGDTVGFIDRTRKVLTDALWVGDEPTGLAISPDGKTLYVSLATMRKVAVVDIEKRLLTTHIDVGFDPRAIVLSPDGKRLYVASYRSGNKVKDTRGTYGPNDDQDIWVIDTATNKVTKTITGISADLRALAISDDGAELYIAATDGDPEPSQAAPMAQPFVHEVVVVAADPAKPGYGTVLRRADLTRQMGSAGPVVNPSGVLAVGDTLWVSSESSNIVVALDRLTLAEKTRTAVGAGARALVKVGDRIAVHSYQAFDVSVLDAAGAVLQQVPVTQDPRPADVTLGERVFTRPGGAFAANHSCSSCHIETQNDGMVWRFGPAVWHNARPLQLLDATTPLEWGAYVSSTDNFGYQGPSSIVSLPATPEEALGLKAFLGSLLGAPKETGRTRLDGSLTEEGIRGEELFNGKAGCYACHVPPLYTTREFLPVGKSGVPADVPSLLGVYRHGVYFVNGQARSLEAAADVALAYVKVTLAPEERADLIEFLYELSPKGAHPLGIWPDIDSAVAVYPNVRPSVMFADPIDDSMPGKTAVQAATDYVILETAAGDKVAGTVDVSGGRVEFVPAAPLTAGLFYRFRVLKGLPFLSGGALWAERVSEFQVAQPAVGIWPKNMKMTVSVPGPGGMIVPLDYLLESVNNPRPGGLSFIVKPVLFGSQQRQEVWARIDADQFHMQSFALPISPTGVGDAAMVVGTVKTVDQATKSISLVEGTLRIGGPGINIPGVSFTIVPM
jgi:DNA-binding beta-propeller fold protein YncE